MSSRTLVLLGFLATVSYGPCTASERWVADFNGIGPVKIGINLRQLNTVLHEKFAMPENKEDQSCFYVNAAKHPHISFMIEGGRLVRVDVDSAGVATTERVKVGDSEKHALEVYGSSIKTTEHAYTPQGHYLTVQSKDGQSGIRFEAENGKIKTFYAGTFKAIQYIEGCQ